MYVSEPTAAIFTTNVYLVLAASVTPDAENPVYAAEGTNLSPFFVMYQVPPPEIAVVLATLAFVQSIANTGSWSKES